MSLINQIHNIVFANPTEPYNEMYRFQVIEFYPDLEQPVCYYVDVAAKEIFFSIERGEYRLNVHGNPFESLDARIEGLGCEAYIYPRFIRG